MDQSQSPPPRIALTIAGFDPSSGAGATADLQVFAAHGVFGTAALTALTVQSTRGVAAVEPVDADLLSRSLQHLEDDLPPHGIKLGMLATEAAIWAVIDYIAAVRALRPLVVVLDPVLRSSSGAALLEPQALSQLRKGLLPLCDVITPNHAELELLVGGAAHTEAELYAGAQQLQLLGGGAAIIVTGGDAATSDDLVVTNSGEIAWLRGEHIESRATHGTGCAFSSSLLCHLLAARPLVDAAGAAKQYVRGAILSAPGLGAGKGPLSPFWAGLPRK